MSRDKQNIKTTDWLIRGIPEEQLKREKREAIKEAEAELRDKQIEEMAKNIYSEYDCIIPCQSCAYFEYGNCRDVKSAEKLYNAGYRKSTDVAEEIFELIDCAFSPVLVYNGYTVKEYLAELKKKYIGKDTNVTTNKEDK